MKRWTFVGASLLALMACRKDAPQWKQHTFAAQEQSREAVHAHLPRSLWEKITALLANTHGISGSGATHGSLPSIFAPLHVYLVEKNHGILLRGHTEISFPARGGELDLEDYVQPRNGSFYFAVEFLPDAEKLEKKVFFLSQSTERAIDHERFGSGCNTYFDVSGAFQNAMSHEGFLVNTTDGRHVSALAGVYFFAGVDSGKLYLASLTIKDSAHRKWQCPP